MRISDWSSDVCSSDLNRKSSAACPAARRRPYRTRSRIAGPSAWPMSLMHRSRSSPPHAAWRNRARSCLGAREAKTLYDIWQGVEARAARFGSCVELPSEWTFRPLSSTNDNIFAPTRHIDKDLERAIQEIEDGPLAHILPRT